MKQIEDFNYENPQKKENFLTIFGIMDENTQSIIKIVKKPLFL